MFYENIRHPIFSIWLVEPKRTKMRFNLYIEILSTQDHHSTCQRRIGHSPILYKYLILRSTGSPYVNLPQLIIILKINIIRNTSKYYYMFNRDKYLKYKSKYMNLRSQIHGGMKQHSLELAVSNDYGDLQVVLRLHQFITSLNLFNSGQKVLDYGCGFGWYTNLASTKQCDVIGIDPDENSIKIAKNSYPKLNFRVGNKINPEEQNTFDFVFANMVICNIKSHDIKEFFDICYNALKVGGTLFITNCDINTTFKKNDIVQHTYNQDKTGPIVSKPADGELVYVSLLRDDMTYSDAWPNYSWSRDSLIKDIGKSNFDNISLTDMTIDSYYYITATRTMS